MFEQESHLPRSAGMPTDRSANLFYGHPVSAGQSGMSAARSHQNLAHIGFSQPSSIYSPNDRRSSQPGSPMSPVSPVLPQQVNHFPGQQHSPFNGVPITPYGLNSPDSASISSDSPSQVRKSILKNFGRQRGLKNIFGSAGILSIFSLYF